MAFASTSIARRVSMIGALGIAGALLAVSAIVSVLLSRSETEDTRTWIGDKASSLVDAIDSMDDAARQLVERNFGFFRQEFSGAFSLDEASGELRIGSEKLNGNFAQVDNFTTTTGGVATVFAAKGDDFQRITTSLKNTEGARAMGTLMGKQHPAYAAVTGGQPYSGRATLFGHNYMTRYEPVKDAAGKVVGILFIGFDLDAFDSAIERMVARAKFFQRGGSVIVSVPKDASKAAFVSHPNAKGRLVADSLPGFEKTLAGLDGTEALIEDAPDVLGTGAKNNFAVLRKSAKTGWWVLAQVSHDEALASVHRTLAWFWAMLILAIVALGLGLLWMMNRWVAKPLDALTEALSSITAGDLTHAVKSRRNDEIGQLIQQTETMREKLAGAIGAVRESVDAIGTASTEIANGNQDLSQRTEQTASNLQTAASSLTQLTGTVRQTADSAQTANQLVSAAASAAAKGGQVVGQVVSTMDEINTSSRKIGDIISVIDGIAFQTNILALNAAVEAARAGEQGRGFAVVAGEVRSLAQRSAEAAKEIKTLIQASVGRVELGSQLVQQAGTSMNEIVTGVQRVQDIIGEISSASSEQSDGIGSVNQSMNLLDQMTQQNAALVEESAAAAESLRDQAHRLVEAVSVFRVEVHASAPPVPRLKPKAAPKLAPKVTAAKPVAGKKPPKAALIESAMRATSPAATAPRAAPPTAMQATGDGDWETF